MACSSGKLTMRQATLLRDPFASAHFHEGKAASRISCSRVSILQRMRATSNAALRPTRASTISVKEMGTGAADIPPSQSSTRICCACKWAANEGSLIRCSKPGHAEASLNPTFLDDSSGLSVLCTRCQSERLTSNDGRIQSADDSPTATDGMNIGRLCEQCYQTSKDPSAKIVGQVKEAHSGPAPSASSDQTITQVLLALQKLQQGQREIQQQQLEMKATLDALVQKVQQQHNASLKRRANDGKDAVEELQRR